MKYDFESPETTIEDKRWLDLVNTVSRAAEYKKDSEAGHNQRVGQYSALIAKKLGIPDEEVSTIQEAAQLHDLGAIFIPENILLKKDKLSSEEFEVVKSHIGLGLNLLGQSQSPVIKMARLIIETHHEDWDGGGYPMGLRGLRIPLVGQIVAVADVFDTLIHDQPYRKAWSVSDAVAEIKSQSNKKFDPQVVKAFLQVIDDRSYLPETKANKMREVLLRGKLGDISIFDLLSLIAQNSQSGTLKLYMGVSIYEIIIYEGKVIDAKFDYLRGEIAVVKIATKTNLVNKAKFIFEAWKKPPPTDESIKIRKDMNQLLLDVAVRIDHDIKELKKSVFRI